MYEGDIPDSDESDSKMDGKDEMKFRKDEMDGCTGGLIGKEEIKMKKKWVYPISDDIKIIDFGGATYDDEQHNSIINTR